MSNFVQSHFTVGAHMIDDKVNNLTMCKWELYVYLHAT